MSVEGFVVSQLSRKLIKQHHFTTITATYRVPAIYLYLILHL